MNRRAAIFAAILAIAMGCCPCLAAVVSTGSVTYDGQDYRIGRDDDGVLTVDNGSVVSCSGGLYVSYVGRGTMNVLSGGQVTSDHAYVGYSSRPGNVFVSGDESTWVNSGDLNVRGGTLQIENGGRVTNASATLEGRIACAVTVNGAGSIWENAGDLSIDMTGLRYVIGNTVSGGQHSTLTVSDGGVVTARSLLASPTDLLGNGSISVAGTVLDTDLVFDQQSPLAKTITFGSGGTLNITFDGSGKLGAGFLGTGSIRIDEGRLVASSGGYLGYTIGSAGTALVTGGAIWSNVGELVVGKEGQGTLLVEAGGQVVTDDGYIGGGLLGSAASVTGAGSTWTNRNSLHVGTFGVGSLVPDSGSLTVNSGGEVIATTLYASSADLYGDGVISVHGLVTDMDVVFDALHGTTQSLSFGSGGSLQLIADGTGDLGAGYKNKGSLRIADGVTVRSAAGHIGYGGDGVATVTGAGSAWITEVLNVGGGSSGKLNVEAGGQVIDVEASLTSGTATIRGAGSTWRSTGTLKVDGAIQAFGGPTGGKLTVGDGGKIEAESLVNNGFVRLFVSGDEMLVLGSDTHNGSVSNQGIFEIIANAFLPEGTYSPVTEYSERPINWTGNEVVSRGGTWNGSDMTFTVAAPLLLQAGTRNNSIAGQRIIITDLATGRRAGVYSWTSGFPLTVVPLGASDRNELSARVASFGLVLDGWNFSNYIAGDGTLSIGSGGLLLGSPTGLISFDIGPGFRQEDLAVWQMDSQGTWNRFYPAWMSYDFSGIASLTVDSFGKYAISQTPEPATLTLLTLCSLAVLRRRK